ncbi:MAG TPA: cytochrome C biogenesis protein [Porphyromonadaceae bacterium]|nr:cytochrome C biogenesis protein [Porphyromonadaceae bacterium]
MYNNLTRIISSPRSTIVLLSLYAILLAGATFIEKLHGTIVAKEYVYYSPVLLLLQFAMILNFIGAIDRLKLFRQKKWGVLISHIAFIVILIGAFVTHVFGEEGMVHIREGQKTNQLVIQKFDRTELHSLPFEIELVDFSLNRYPGSSSPSSYESLLRVYYNGTTFDQKVFMNNVMDLEGYRFFQASYDQDEKGTILSVNKDVAGRYVTYLGYLLLVVGFIYSLIGKNSRLRFLNNRLKTYSNKLSVFLVFLFMGATSICANESMNFEKAAESMAIPKVEAEKFGLMPMQMYNGRMVPVNTFSNEVMRKLHKDEMYNNQSADQVLLGILTYPQIWSRIPLIEVPNKQIVKNYALNGKMCAYVDLFDQQGNYKLQSEIDQIYNKMPNERNQMDKDLLKLDEKVNIFYQLINGRLLNLFPLENDQNHKWFASGDDLSSFSEKDSMFVSRIFDWYTEEVAEAVKSGDWSKTDEVLSMISTYQSAKNNTLQINQSKLKWESYYNKMHVFRHCFKLYLILGGILLVISLAKMFEEKPVYSLLFKVFALLIGAVFIVHTFGMGLRWYVSGYAPWSNSYETMVYVGWATMFGGLLFIRRSPITFALASLFTGVILFVSGLNWMDPQINALVPVLKSPWLMFHVAVIVAAYGFFGISTLLGLFNLVLMSFGKKQLNLLVPKIKEFTIINEMSMLIGLILMTVGTFLGAVWANESWGRYWGWDPKETWALITMVVYAIVTHIRLINKINILFWFNLLSVFSFASVLMTFLGVNYFLSGMHSYGKNDAFDGISLYLYIVLIILSVISLISYMRMGKLLKR